MKNFKNDQERIAFLENYRDEENGWKLWKGDVDAKIRWWRLELPDCDFMVEEWQQTFSYPKKEKKWHARQRYIIRDIMEPFADQQASRTLQLAELKRIGKEQKTC